MDKEYDGVYKMEIIDNSIVEPIEMKMIRPSKLSVRYAILSNSSSEMLNLKSSIKTHGLLQPILIRPLDNGFEIVAGRRRFVACRSLRWRFIPCKIIDLSDRQAYEIQLAENIQRKSMDPMEEAEAYQKYVHEYGWGGVSELALQIGKSPEYVSHRMQLLKLSDDVRQKIVSNNLSASQALELTGIGDTSLESGLVEEIIDNNLTVKQIRVRKKTIKTESHIHKQSRSKSDNLMKKTNLSLKITLSRIDDLIEDAHSITPKEQRKDVIAFLMGLRLKTHSMIDETIYFKKKHL